MISPRLRSDAAYLHESKIPTGHNGYLMAEWHFYASGPSKTNGRKLWTTGTAAEKALVNEKIELALAWQKQTGVPTWVPGCPETTMMETITALKNRSPLRII